jgi:hypothetical protein
LAALLNCSRSGCGERAPENGTPNSTFFLVQDPVKHGGPAVVVPDVSPGSRDSSTKYHPPATVIKQSVSRRRHAESPGFNTSSIRINVDTGKAGKISLDFGPAPAIEEGTA